jgi:hypothetical protein
MRQSEGADKIRSLNALLGQIFARKALQAEESAPSGRQDGVPNGRKNFPLGTKTAQFVPNGGFFLPLGTVGQYKQAARGTTTRSPCCLYRDV